MFPHPEFIIAVTLQNGSIDQEAIDWGHLDTHNLDRTGADVRCERL